MRLIAKRRNYRPGLCRRVLRVLGSGRVACLPGRPFGCAVLFLAVVLLFPSAGPCSEVHLYLNNGDHISGKELLLDDKTLSVLTSHCGKMVVERSAVKGISQDTEHAADILDFVGESDIVHTHNGDRLSGKVAEIKDDAVLMKASFAGEATAKVELKELDYLTFASQGRGVPPSKSDEVRVIFINGDVISGRIMGFEGKELVLRPPYCENVRFEASAFRSVHNAKESREFFQGGIAEAIMDVLERSGESRRVDGQLYPVLIRSFLKSNDKSGALLVFRRVLSYVTYQYIFQAIGDEFLANNMPEAAIQAYEKMMELSPTYYYAYGKVFDAYVKMGRLKEAAETYERVLSMPATDLASYGTNIAKVRMDLSDVYMKLKEFDKAAEQLRLLVVSPSEEETTRRTALSKLISIFKEKGKIEALTESYKAELAEKNKVIGESYVEMVKIYLGEGKVMKAKTYVKRLKELGLTEYAEKAQQLIGE